MGHILAYAEVANPYLKGFLDSLRCNVLLVGPLYVLPCAGVESFVANLQEDGPHVLERNSSLFQLFSTALLVVQSLHVHKDLHSSIFAKLWCHVLVIEQHSNINILKYMRHLWVIHGSEERLSHTAFINYG